MHYLRNKKDGRVFYATENKGKVSGLTKKEKK